MAACCVLLGRSRYYSIVISDYGTQNCSTLSGYYVTAPNLIGHGSRVSTDYSLSSIADDPRPYIEERNYSLIIGHSLGWLTVLVLSAQLSPSHQTTVILLEPPLQATEEIISLSNNVFSDACINPRTGRIPLLKILYGNAKMPFRGNSEHVCVSSTRYTTCFR